MSSFLPMNCTMYATNIIRFLEKQFRFSFSAPILLIEVGVSRFRVVVRALFRCKENISTIFV